MYGETVVDVDEQRFALKDTKMMMVLNVKCNACRKPCFAPGPLH